MSMNSHDSNTSDSQGDHRDTMTPDANQATHAAGKERVVRDVKQSGQATPQTSSQAAQPKSGDYDQSRPLTKTSGKRPGEVSPELGQDSGSDWQESQQMGQTGHGGVQNPQKNP